MSMVAALALMAAAQVQTQPQTLTVHEVPEPGVGVTCFQAVIKYKPAGRDDAAAWDVLGQTLLAGTDDYTIGEIMRTGGLSGYRPRVVTMPGYLRLEYTVPTAMAESGAKIVAQCLTAPRFREDRVEDAKANLAQGFTDAFDQALQLEKKDYSKVTVEQVKELYQRTFRPATISLYVGGDFNVGEIPTIMTRYTREWKPDLYPRPPVIQLLTNLPTKVTGTESYELRSTPLTPSSPFAAARFLAVIALGVAKDCTMHRVLREQHGWSYRNEGVLYPSVDGWTPRFIMLHDGPEGVALLEEMRKAMAADMDTWTDQTLQRAIVLGKASLREGFVWSPVWIDGYSPMRSDVVDRLALASYLDMVGAGGVSPKTWAMTLENVDLETLKAQAKEMVEKASGIYLEKE